MLYKTIEEKKNMHSIRIYLPCLQLILLMNRDEDPPLFFNLKSGRMANDDICSGKLFAKSVCCFGFSLGINFN